MTVSDKAYFLNTSKSSYDPAITMPVPRRAPFCGVIKNKATGEPEKVMVGGGYYQSQYRDDYDIYDLKAKTWAPSSECNNVEQH